jgi:hypothetical protein
LKKFNEKELTVIKDEENPEYIFSTIFSSIILKFLNKELDIEKLLKQELIKRGLDKKGIWVGFEKSRQIHQID